MAQVIEGESGRVEGASRLSGAPCRDAKMTARRRSPSSTARTQLFYFNSHAIPLLLFFVVVAAQRLKVDEVEFPTCSSCEQWRKLKKTRIVSLLTPSASCLRSPVCLPAWLCFGSVLFLFLFPLSLLLLFCLVGVSCVNGKCGSVCVAVLPLLDFFQQLDSL